MTQKEHKMLAYFVSSCCKVSLFILFFGFAQMASGQDMAPDIAFNPKNYICYKVSASFTIDGQLEEPVWEQAPWTDDFVDIKGKAAPDPRYQTNVKMLWDDAYLYVAARLEEPHVWGTLQQRDTIIFHNNNFEFFVDPDGDTHQYYELEVNALGTFWDLMLTKPYRDGGKAIDSWDMRGLKVGIDVKGSLNDPTDTDSGWTVELAIPWKDLVEASGDGKKPMPGDQWRINFSRIEWKYAIKNNSYHRAINPQTKELYPEDNWVWSPQGVVNMHYPEMWGFVQFAGKNQAQFEWQPKEYIKWYLRQLYYRQHNYRKKSGAFTTDLQLLQAKQSFDELKLSKWYPELSLPAVYATKETFEIHMFDPKNKKVWHIRENGQVWSLSSQK